MKWVRVLKTDIMRFHIVMSVKGLDVSNTERLRFDVEDDIVD